MTPKRSFAEKLVVRIPYAWLIAFFLVPFLIVFKISFSQSAIALPPYTPVLDFAAGWRGIEDFFGFESKLALNQPPTPSFVFPTEMITLAGSAFPIKRQLKNE